MFSSRVIYSLVHPFSFIPSLYVSSKYILSSFKNPLGSHVFLFHPKRSSFSSHKHFVPHSILFRFSFHSNQKIISIPGASEILTDNFCQSLSQWFGINAIFHKRIENSFGGDARTRSFSFRYRFTFTNHWQRNGLDTVSRFNSRCENTILASRRRWIVSLNHKWKRGRYTSRFDRVIQYNDNNWILVELRATFYIPASFKSGRLQPRIERFVVTNHRVLVKSSSLILLSRDRNVHSWDTTCMIYNSWNLSRH